MLQTRTINFSLDLKSLSNRQFEGYGSVFGNVDLGGDVVIPGAFSDTLAAHRLKNDLPKMFWMHDPREVPGVWTSMSEDSEGLYVKGELADTQLGNEMRTLLGMKAVRGLSIGYRIEDYDRDVAYDREGNRLLKRIDLWEVSLVSLAMNPLAEVTASKSRLSDRGEYVPTERELEGRLRDAGCSKSVARMIVSKVYDAEAGGTPADLPRRDAGEVDAEAASVLDSIARLSDRIGAASVRRF